MYVYPKQDFFCQGNVSESVMLGFCTSKQLLLFFNFEVEGAYAAESYVWDLDCGGLTELHASRE